MENPPPLLGIAKSMEKSIEAASEAAAQPRFGTGRPLLGETAVRKRGGCQLEKIDMNR